MAHPWPKDMTTGTIPRVEDLMITQNQTERTIEILQDLMVTVMGGKAPLTEDLQVTGPLLIEDLRIDHQTLPQTDPEGNLSQDKMIVNQEAIPERSNSNEGC